MPHLPLIRIVGMADAMPDAVLARLSAAERAAAAHHDYAEAERLSTVGKAIQAAAGEVALHRQGEQDAVAAQDSTKVAEEMKKVESALERLEALTSSVTASLQSRAQAASPSNGFWEQVLQSEDPEGWHEAVSANGDKHYIHSVTQQMLQIHPLRRSRSCSSPLSPRRT